MTSSIENFIKVVYQIIYDDQEKAIPSRIASDLKISNAAVTDMARKLNQSSLINYIKYVEIKLTPSGEKLALKVIRKHRLWELFLQEVLHLSDRDIHIEAELLEHNTTDYLINRIDEFLGYPKFDPHGDPIPDTNYRFPDTETLKSLNQCLVGPTYIIKRLIHRTNELSSFYRDHNLKLGEELALDQILPENNVIVAKFHGDNLVMGSNVSKYIFVKEK